MAWMACAAVSALGLPISVSRYNTWRFRFVSSIQSGSMIRIEPNPAIAAKRAAALPIPPAPAMRRRVFPIFSCPSSPITATCLRYRSFCSWFSPAMIRCLKAQFLLLFRCRSAFLIPTPQGIIFIEHIVPAPYLARGGALLQGLIQETVWQRVVLAAEPAFDIVEFLEVPDPFSDLQEVCSVNFHSGCCRKEVCIVLCIQRKRGEEAHARCIDSGSQVLEDLDPLGFSLGHIRVEFLRCPENFRGDHVAIDMVTSPYRGGSRKPVSLDSPWIIGWQFLFFRAHGAFG